MKIVVLGRLRVTQVLKPSRNKMESSWGIWRPEQREVASGIIWWSTDQSSGVSQGKRKCFESRNENKKAPCSIFRSNDIRYTENLFLKKGWTTQPNSQVAELDSYSDIPVLKNMYSFTFPWQSKMKCLTRGPNLLQARLTNVNVLVGPRKWNGVVSVSPIYHR